MIKTCACILNNDDVRMDSSSGAVFSALAEYTLSQKGKVYGVAMSSDNTKAEYISVDDMKDLYKLRGSKYLQAVVGDAYKQVKEDLMEGVKVLFTGTGCQVNGLKNFLGKDYDNLLCADVICHGTPSPKVWKEYVKLQEKNHNGSLKYINFRCKNPSWENFGSKEIISSVENHEELYISKDEDVYMKLFLRNYDLRESCYNCIAKKIKKSDLTIADFWGIDEVAPEMNDYKGTSLVLIRTDKGQKAFDSVSSELKIKEVTYEEGVKANPSEYKSVDRPKQRETFFEDFNSLGIEETSKKYLKESFKHRVKLAIKPIYSPILRILRGGRSQKRIDDYGLLFVFEKK